MNEEFYRQRQQPEWRYDDCNRGSGWVENAQTHLGLDSDIDGQPFDPGQAYDRPIAASDIDGQPLDPGQAYDYDRPIVAYPAFYGGMNDKKEDRRGAPKRNDDDFARRQSDRSLRHDATYSSKYRDNGDDFDRRPRSKGSYDSEDPPSRRSQRSRSRDRDRDRDSNRRSRDREHSRDRERRARRDDSGHGTERVDSDYRSRRRSRSRDRDRRHRDSDRDRHHRDSDRDRPPRRDRDWDQGERESSPKDVPWVPPPLPQHLQHLQIQSALNSGSSSGLESSSWLIAKPPRVQNQFQNDGSFLAMFRQKMQAAPVSSDNSSTSEGPSYSALNVGIPAETVTPLPAPKPTLAANSSGMPVVARRRTSKILKTGIVLKKKKEEEEEPEDKDGDGWSSYMKEVQKYRANKCIENEASRPPLVK
ncbi:hypothetical protein ACOMHN_061286 [Nucella lapillus]